MNVDNTHGRFYDEVIASLRATLAADSVPVTQIDAEGARISSWAGFQFVDIARLEANALIAFHWHETGNQTFVHVVDLSYFTDRGMSVSLANQIISANLFEWIGDGWHLQVPTTQVRGLTFMEPRQGRGKTGRSTQS